MTTDYSNVKFDINSLKNTVKSFVQKLWVLRDYKGSVHDPPPKLYVVPSGLKIDDRYGQGVRRWICGDSRYQLCKYLSCELNDLCLVLNMITIAVNHDRFDSKLQTIRDSLLELVNSIEKGLESLLYLYPEYEMFNSSIHLSLDKMKTFKIAHDTRPISRTVTTYPFINPLD